MVQLRSILKPADNSGAKKLAIIGEIGRSDGTYIRFDDNAGVVIDKQGLPLGTRILGPIAREIKEIGFNKIASLAREVV